MQSKIMKRGNILSVNDYLKFVYYIEQQCNVELYYNINLRKDKSTENKIHILNYLKYKCMKF